MEHGETPALEAASLHDAPEEPEPEGAREDGADDRDEVLGLHLISVVGFVLSGAFGLWLLWGVVKSGRL